MKIKLITYPLLCLFLCGCVTGAQGHLLKVLPTSHSNLLERVKNTDCQITPLTKDNELDTLIKQNIYFEISSIYSISIFESSISPYSLRYSFMSIPSSDKNYVYVFGNERKGPHGPDKYVHKQDLLSRIQKTMSKCLKIDVTDGEFITIDNK